jgi:hypothetical protein
MTADVPLLPDWVDYLLGWPKWTLIGVAVVLAALRERR